MAGAERKSRIFWKLSILVLQYLLISYAVYIICHPQNLTKMCKYWLKIEICMAAARILLHWFHVWKYAKLQIMLLFAYETSMKEMQLHYVQYNLQFVSSTGRFPFSWNFRADRKSLILELSMRNRKKMR